MIKLVALDLDGTIVNEQLEISSRTLKLLKHLIENTPVRVVIATGRMHASALPFARTLGIREPIVSYQGAMIREASAPHVLLSHTPIGRELAAQVLGFLQADRFHVNLYVDDTLYTNHGNEHATYYARVSGVTPILSEDLMAALTGPATKIMAIDDH